MMVWVASNRSPLFSLGERAGEGNQKRVGLCSSYFVSPRGLFFESRFLFSHSHLNLGVVVAASPAFPRPTSGAFLEANLFRHQRIPLLSFSGSLHGFFSLSTGSACLRKDIV
ncbi:hypothetical protein AOQ84DRAFT_218769 [Glonium stellatum]|uniref:Uncharacterized protein n=1 Tax=Glonium stellatum TaxID=574774 RepID=A0A8E2F4D8_9PEZI|nr:hypothetical protein AOQ84DRAFT_218769 [Glonium stellatum]